MRAYPYMCVYHYIDLSKNICRTLTLHVYPLQVRKEDQLRINEFGRNNAQLHDVRDQKKALNETLDTLDDASTDVMMGEGDAVQ